MEAPMMTAREIGFAIAALTTTTLLLAIAAQAFF
jgi:hypothetical protein